MTDSRNLSGRCLEDRKPLLELSAFSLSRPWAVSNPAQTCLSCFGVPAGPTHLVPLAGLWNQLLGGPNQLLA